MSRRNNNYIITTRGTCVVSKPVAPELAKKLRLALDAAIAASIPRRDTE